LNADQASAAGECRRLRDVEGFDAFLEVPGLMMEVSAADLQGAATRSSRLVRC
jgi:hypothetical protein